MKAGNTSANSDLSICFIYQCDNGVPLQKNVYDTYPFLGRFLNPKGTVINHCIEVGRRGDAL